MALTDVDLKKIGKVVDERIEERVGKIVDEKIFQALDQMVLPELMKLEGKMGKLGEAMATKEDLAAVEERLTKRIDRVAEITTDTRTNHERRIRKLEDEVGVVPETRLSF